MKDITRIHIAKVPYSIELTAKKDLEKYIHALELYTGDSELLVDIEIRITELLLERGIKQEAVISEADVKAIREQLGEPKEFMSEDDETIDIDGEAFSEVGSRKLFRNLDNALLGGLLSGIASYLGVRVLWVRLAFVFLIFVSFGLSVLLYLVAWLIVPPARTTAEKIQMTGRPVTLSSIREVNASSAFSDGTRRAAVIKRILTIALGIIAILVGLVSVVALVVAGIELIHGTVSSKLSLYQVPIILMAAGGILLIALSLLTAIASFTQKFNKRIWISGIIIITLGVLCTATAFAYVTIQQQNVYDTIRCNTIETSEKLPTSFSTVTSLSIDIPSSTNFNYVVDPSMLTIKQRMLKGSPKVKVAIDNGVATISLDVVNEQLYNPEATVTIYGPAIESIIVTNGSMSYNVNAQSKLMVEAHNQSMVSLGESRIDAVTVTLDKTAQFSGDVASISSVNAFLSGHPSASFGNIKTLTVKSLDSCAANTAPQLNVQNILNATYDFNGVQAASQSMKKPCFELNVGDQYSQTNY